MTQGTPEDAATSHESAGGRRFGVYDLLAVVAGVAILCCFRTNHFGRLAERIVRLCRAVAASFGVVPAAPNAPPDFLSNAIATYALGAAWDGIQAGELLILVATPVFLLMRIQRPRPSLRGLLRQPGTVAGLAAAFGLAFVASGMHRVFLGRLVDGTVIPLAVGCAVALAWTCQALLREWNPEGTWIDRLGQILGVTAIVTGLFTVLMVSVVP